MKQTTMKEFLSGIDIEMLKDQKADLIRESFNEGLVSLIDKIQDIAVDEFGYDEKSVFHTEEDIELPSIQEKPGEQPTLMTTARKLLDACQNALSTLTESAPDNLDSFDYARQIRELEQVITESSLTLKQK